MKTAAEMQPQEGDFAMKKGLSIQEKLKDLRVVEKGFTLKQLADCIRRWPAATVAELSGRCAA